MTVQELYASTVRPLSPPDRLRLATLILDELPVVGAAPVDVSDDWTDEDIADMTAHSMRYAEERYPSELDADA